MADDLFQQIDADETPVVDQTKEYYPELVGEGKKYATQEDLAKAAVHKDMFIEQLKRENAEARQTISERINMEQFLAKIEAAKTAEASPNGLETSSNERDDKASAVTPETIEKILEARETKQKRDANLKAVESRLKETFGAQWQQRVREKALALNTSTQWLTDVAARNPEAFLELLGANAQRPLDTFSPPPRGSVTSAPQTNSQKDYAYYQKQKAEKGEAWYNSIPVRQEIWKELIAQGEQAFYKK